MLEPRPKPPVRRILLYIAIIVVVMILFNIFGPKGYI